MSRLARERGAVTVWLLGLCITVLFLGGVSLDLWRAFAERRALAGAADAAAVAGASGLDTEQVYDGGRVLLDPGLAEARARASLDRQEGLHMLTAAAVQATPTQVTVRVEGTVELTLLGILSAGDSLPIAVTATSEPRLGRAAAARE